MIVTNRGANPTSTFRAWGFYKRVREQFGEESRDTDLPRRPDRARPCNSAEDKLVCFVDDHGRRLEVAGINFGYDGGAEIGNGKAIGMQRISQTSVWYGGMTLNSKAIHEHCVSGGVNRESGCSAMRNGGVGTTSAPRHRVSGANHETVPPRSPPRTTRSPTAARKGRTEERHIGAANGETLHSDAKPAARGRHDR
jgi:hypothetical protein